MSYFIVLGMFMWESLDSGRAKMSGILTLMGSQFLFGYRNPDTPAGASE